MVHGNCCSYQATTLSTFILCINVDERLICSIRINIEEVMAAQTSAVLSTTPRSLLSQGALPRQCPPQIVISHSSHLQLGRFLRILKYGRHKLLTTHGLTLETPSFCGWEVFLTPGALNRTRITWAFSPMAPQVLCITPGSSLYPWCYGYSSWRGAQQQASKNTWFFILISAGNHNNKPPDQIVLDWLFRCTCVQATLPNQIKTGHPMHHRNFEPNTKTIFTVLYTYISTHRIYILPW